MSKDKWMLPPQGRLVKLRGRTVLRGVTVADITSDGVWIGPLSWLRAMESHGDPMLHLPAASARRLAKAILTPEGPKARAKAKRR